MWSLDKMALHIRVKQLRMVHLVYKALCPHLTDGLNVLYQQTKRSLLHDLLLGDLHTLGSLYRT